MAKQTKQTISRKSTATDRKTRPSKSSTTPARSKGFRNLQTLDEMIEDETRIFREVMNKAVREGRLKPSDEITGED